MRTNIKSSLKFEGLSQQVKYEINLYSFIMKICEPIAGSS